MKRAEKNLEEKGERKRGGSLSPLPHPLVVVVFFFPAHISLRCPHDLNSWNRLCRDKSRDQSSMSRNIQITEQNDLKMSSLFLAFRW